jgi:beta-glucanase (GH16 family)
MKHSKRLLICFICITLSYCSKSGGSSPVTPVTPIVVPSITINNVTQARDTSGSPTNFTFAVILSASTTDTVKVSYTTIDSSAFAGTDYTAVSGTLVFNPGNTVSVINVPVISNNLRAANQVFHVQLSNPLHATVTGMGTGTGIIENLGNNLGTDSSGYTTPASYVGYNLLWSDEFNEAAINTNVWGYDLGNGGWGNAELECYTNSSNNSFISNGCLIIQARKESAIYNGVASNYTSARLNTAGKFSFQYGRMDIRAKLPVATGLWPALWMLGNNFSSAGWPGCGETDLMELIGTNPNLITGSVHWLMGNGSEGTSNNTYTLPAGTDFSQKFHVFSLIWQANQIQMYVDDILYMTASSSSISSGNWPFNQPQFLIFNVAVGGNWPGSPSASTVFPQNMFVDYVRVFQPK